MNILIIGHGVVGRNMAKIFPEADTYDITYSEKRRKLVEGKKYDLSFVCVPTNMLPNGCVDVGIVENVINFHQCHVENFCIKSTIPPGETDHIISEIYSDVCFSPEYFGGTQHANNHNYDFLIVGGSQKACEKTKEAHQEIFSAELKMFTVSAKVAELVKYGENAWLGMKVSFCNEFARICESFGVDYDEWREMWLLDPRINRSHTFVYKDKPYYDSHCLNKDIPGIINASIDSGYIPYLLMAMQDYNDSHKIQ